MMHVERTNSLINGLNIAESVAGGGDTIVMLHGWGANVDLVWPLGERLVRLGYRVYAMDLPGFGESDAPGDPWGVFDYAKFVITYLDAHQLDRVHLFGHSFGGRLGLILGAEYSNRINKLVLADAAGIVEKAPLAKRVRLGAYKSVRDGLYKVGAKNLADHLRQAYNARYGSADLQQTSGIMRQVFINVVNQDLRDYAQRVRPSTLLIWGDKDEETPLWYGQTFEKLIPDAGLVIHKGAGHYSYLEYLPETARVMDYFFKNDE
ncbi:alpha/beta hydrolase [Phototrophicus methaneseepsis]|uniref:Alpha/beta hydrolase n=1 Tax=Phototrophicus methaneseepsis TaxID=2710758 RepID=A0A7S8ICP5_9CHLR|nr:alpha/beta hydrolase [Phototrophicus methaneseepsis]QPC80686.1 alpha/beta hydrolase [Phototrophicus methaneseepsis]